MGKFSKRILTALLSMSMIAGTLVPAVSAKAAVRLVNVAGAAAASTENGEYGTHVIANINDGDDTTSWQTSGIWPSTAVLQLDMGRSISKIVVKLGERGDNATGRTALVTVQYAQNGITSDLIDFGTKRMTVDSDGEFIVDTPVSATHIYVTLSDPRNADGTAGGFWPSVEEVEIYEQQDAELSAYQNIAAQAEVRKNGNSDGNEANLTDGNDRTLYKFHNAQQTSEKEIVLTYASARSMDAFRIAFEKVATEPYDYKFTYSIQARNGSGEYDTIADHVVADRTENWEQTYSISEKTYTEAKIVMHSCRTYRDTANGWPAVAEFEIYGSEEEVDDDGSISFGKPVHVSSGKSLAKNITDGSLNSAWRGSYYPAYVDIDLEENYNLDTVTVFTPSNGYSQYTIYTSMNGRDNGFLFKESHY
ncbi:MAG: discoidin domain-containing protein [Lachnospiraceae bacterium]